MRESLGDYIDGSFQAPTGTVLTSTNPVDGTTVFETAADAKRVGTACEAAAAAQSDWRARSYAERRALVATVIDQIKADGGGLAEALTLEIGKIDSEAKAEVASLVGRLALVDARIREDLPEGQLPGFPGESLRHHPHGVTGVIGPFNYPLHLCHAYVIPALLLGNTVVVKPSEVAPLTAQRYAEMFAKSDLPAGVWNLVQGGRESAQALLEHPSLRAVCFTGSWNTGRQILDRLRNRPEVMALLEMGGKNTAVVLDDADLRQAAHEIALGGYLTTGQRCTCTDRVLVQPSVRQALLDTLAPLVEAIHFGPGSDPKAFGGPLATVVGRDRFRAALEKARAAGAELIAHGSAAEGGLFVRPTLHALPAGTKPIAGYSDTELFGPDLCVESVDDEAHAASLIAGPESGFVHSVFTADRSRFERIYLDISCGMLNLNRSTNRASPRLPFGGVAHSGNFRPAGSYTPRALSIPVAVLENPLGTMIEHPTLAAALPPIDLDRLEAEHNEEERVEGQRTLLDDPRPLSMSLPEAGKLPSSDAYLARFYQGERSPREKKPGVFDHLRSNGPWFVSIDDPPLSVIDGMSQTATVPAGFAADAVVKAYVEGAFGEGLLSARDTSQPGDVDVAAYADTLRRLVPGLEHVTFVNSGAESCEKALSLCRNAQTDPRRTKVLAFEGGFHGRTLLSLHASFNPSKREPFQIAGYEVAFAPFPVWWSPQRVEPEVPAGLLPAAADGNGEALKKIAADPRDELLASEAASLEAVHRSLSQGDFFAVIVEPMQSEGGDRYGTARFFRALRLLTRHHNVPLIMDEVQTGFGLGGTFTWFSRFGLVDRKGRPDLPDCLTFAKRAQVGVVMSRFADPEPSATSSVSLVRGRLHAELMADDQNARKIEKQMREGLAELARRHPDLVEHPRATGYASAFELPTPAHLGAYVAQRFWRGNIVFAAGSRTVRHRLNTSFTPKDVERVLEAMHRSLAFLESQPGHQPPAWMDVALPAAETAEQAEAKAEAQPVVGMRLMAPEEADEVLAALRALEERLFEPARRDTEEWLRLGLEGPDAVAVLAEVTDDADGVEAKPRLVGAAIGGPLENVASAEGPDRDPMLGRNNTFYTVSVVVDTEYKGQGLGRCLKTMQLEEAARRQTPGGGRRYLHASGRNRVGKTAPIRRVNASLGAYEVCRLDNQYGEPGAQASYYRMPLGAFVVDAAEPSPSSDRVDFVNGLVSPVIHPPASLVAMADTGQLFGPAVNKLTICNYITPAIVRAVEWVSALTPDHPHLYLTSSRDEAFDKSLRVLRFHRKASRVAIGFEGGYVGHTTAAARSLSDPAVHRQGPVHFDNWARVPHPETVGLEATIAAIHAAVDRAGGAENVIGLFLEPLQERTGRALIEPFFRALAQLRTETGIPVVFFETAGAFYRTGRGPFYGSSAAFTPDMVAWWGGGQVGFVHLTKEQYIATPLMMVSTWDGDEMSLIRVHHMLRAARTLSVTEAADRLNRALTPLSERGTVIRGAGLFRVAQLGDQADPMRERLAAAGIVVQSFPHGFVSLAMPFDAPAAWTDRLQDALKEGFS